MGRVIMSGIAPLLTVPKTTHIYGAIWDGSSSTAWTRTDEAVGFADPNPAVANGTGSSPFDNIMPWSGMQRVTDPEAGELVSIPKFWYKWTKDGNSLKLQIANGAVDGFYVSPAHADRGDGKGERDMVYVGRYHCGSDYKSTSGVTPVYTSNRNSWSNVLSSIGDTIWQYDYATHITIQMLYLVEFADWDSQTKIGTGYTDEHSSPNNTGGTDIMTYHTGRTSNTSGNNMVQYRHIENLWSNVSAWVEGINLSNGWVYICTNPKNFNVTVTSAYTRTTFISGSDGYISGVNISTDIPWVMTPSGSSGSQSGPIPDYFDYTSSATAVQVGGACDLQLNEPGLFYFNMASTGSTTGRNGARLMKLP